MFITHSRKTNRWLSACKQIKLTLYTTIKHSAFLKKNFIFWTPLVIAALLSLLQVLFIILFYACFMIILVGCKSSNK